MVYRYERIYKDLSKGEAQRQTKRLRIAYGRNVKLRKDPNGRYEVWAVEYYKVKK